VARIEARLRVQRPAPPNVEQLRHALEERCEQWTMDLRAPTEVARTVLRRLIGPILLWDDTGTAELLRWDAETKTDLLDGIVLHMASPMPASWNQIGPWLRQIDALRRAA
jgi:hypothetical protein